ncbi:hypothetical protein HG619_07790 [Pseudomonas syringae]|nr:hypothetical protein [Pseudomonas syringae]
MNILSPGIYLTNRLRFPAKFAVLAIIIVIPLIVLGLRVFNSLNASIDTVAQERVGREYLQLTTPFCDSPCSSARSVTVCSPAMPLPLRI